MRKTTQIAKLEVEVTGGGGGREKRLVGEYSKSLVMYKKGMGGSEDSKHTNLI